MVLTHTVYIAASIIFALVITYMVYYNIKLKSRKATLQTMGRPPLTTQEGIAIATEQKEQSQKHTLS